MLALEFADPADYDRIDTGHVLAIDFDDLDGGSLTARDEKTGDTYDLRHRLSPRQLEAVRAGGRIPLPARRLT